MEQISEILSFVGGVLITVYATHQAVIALAGKANDWMEGVAGLGGVLYLFGVYLAGSRVLNDAYVIAYALQSVGVGLMLLPRVVRITYLSLKDAPGA